MRIKSLLLGTCALFMLSIGCTTDDNIVVIQGNITDIQTGNAIESATVQVTAPQAYTDLFARSDASGLYSIGDINVSEVTDLTITVSATNYEDLSQTIKVAPGDNITGFDFEMTAINTGGNTGGEGVSGPSAGAAAIILQSITEETINIAETGGTVNTSFSFQVQDSSGRNLDINNAEEVTFSIISGPGGGEGITPASATTNANGIVTSNLFSGNLAGPVQIQAEIVRADIGLTIRSRPVAITIHGGFPDLNHFSIAAQNSNFEGWSFNGSRNPLTVILGDEFGNPVKPGTAVYFTTTGGIIQGSASGNTDEDGIVTVDLISGDPRPTDAVAGSGGRNGYATVTASTINGNNVEIEKSVIVVFSSSSAFISATPTTFDLAPNGGATINYTVEDVNGNPMAAGTQFSVVAGDGIEVTGSSDFKLSNFLYPGPGATEFQFSIRDTDDQSNDPAALTIQIKVTTPSGEETTYQLSGTRRK